VLTWRATRFPSGLFHPSDMFGLGRTVDIRRWWSAPLYPFSARARFEDEPPLISEPGDGVPLNELAPEQYIWISALRRSTDVYLKAYPSPEDLRRELFFLINNFTVVEPARAEVEWLKGVEMPFGYQAPVIGHSEYRFLYRKWIEGRRLQVPPFSVAWKHLQLAMRKWTPDLLKPVWRFIKSFVLKSSRS
jgi:hypothetical protein